MATSPSSSRTPDSFPPCPEGYYPANNTPLSVVCWKPNLINLRESNFDNVNELDFNNYTYLVTKPPYGYQEKVSDKVLQEIVMKPGRPWIDEWKTMVMIPVGGGPIRAAHLPNIVDIWPIVDFAEVVWKLDNFNNEYSGESKVVPNFLKSIVNPRPALEFGGEIYHLNRSNVEVIHGCFTDAVNTFHIDGDISELRFRVCADFMKEGEIVQEKDPRFRCFRTRFIPVCVDMSLMFKRGWCVIVWNARDVTRPSFIANFFKLVSIHDPVLLILTEVRVSHERFKLVLSEIGRSKFGFILDESWGLEGGTVAVWDTTRAMPDCRGTPSRNDPCRMVGCLKPVKQEDSI